MSSLEMKTLLTSLEAEAAMILEYMAVNRERPGCAMEFPALLSLVHILPLGGSTVFAPKLKTEYYRAL
jgi:hypothetical protein